MSPATISTTRVARPQRRNWFLAAALVVAVGAGVLASSDLEDRGQPTGPSAWPAGPIEFGDPAVAKGARGGKTNTVTFPLFRDPTVRKGAGGQR
jgi:hypothetical protein